MLPVSDPPRSLTPASLKRELVCSPNLQVLVLSGWLSSKPKGNDEKPIADWFAAVTMLVTNNPRVRVLDLGGIAGITDEDLRRLHKARHLKRLVFGTPEQVTREGLDALRAAGARSSRRRTPATRACHRRAASAVTLFRVDSGVPAGSSGG